MSDNNNQLKKPKNKKWTLTTLGLGVLGFGIGAAITYSAVTLLGIDPKNVEDIIK